MTRLLLAAIGLACVLPTAASAATVTLKLSGSDYNGGPAFQLTAGDVSLGSGVVDPMPAAGQGQDFTFDVPDAVLAESPLQLHFTNDAHGGPGQDRNLYILAAAIDGRDVPLDQFQVLLKGEPHARPLSHGHLDLWSGNEIAVAAPPNGGWLVAELTPAPAVAAAPACDAEVAITGITNIHKPLSDVQVAALAPLIDQAKAGKCSVTISGYASPGGGTADVNKRVSVARAKLVMTALQKAGLQFAATTLNGLGETSKFGVEAAPNQRVEVKLGAGPG